MTRTCLIGHSGFVGANLTQQHSFDDLYRSTNIQEIRGRSYGLVICAGVSAAKWKANKAPDEDRAAIDGLLNHLLTIKADRFVLISTVDVYPVATGVDEAFDCSNRPNHAYGTNRLYLEQALAPVFSRLSVVRLPGLFGPGLKKNVIFDLLHDNCLNVINPDSVFQYYDMTAIWQDLQVVLEHQLPLINLATEPVPTRRIHQELFPEKEIGSQPAPAAAYDIHTRHAGLFGENSAYRFDSDEVLSRLRRFVDLSRREPSV